MKRTSILAAASILAMVGGGVTASANTVFPGTGNAESPVKVIIETDGEIEVPPVDPEEPPIDPENPNLEAGPLDILYVSPLDFGTVVLNGEEQLLNAASDKDLSGQEFENMVSIQDRRSDANRQGWSLTVRYEQDFLDGAEIKMNPFIHETNQEEYGIQSGGEITLSNSAVVFAETSQSGYGRHTVSMGMAQPDEAVQLVIPGEDYETGEYTTTLIWELTDGPIA